MHASPDTRHIGSLGVVAVLLLLPLAFGGCATTGINKGQMNIISTEQEVQLGKELSVEVARQYPLYDGAAVAAYVQTVGQRIVQHSDRQDIAYHFAVVNKREMNAFSLPGGYVYAYTALMQTAGDEAEYAAVVAHEVAHVAARHSTERLTEVYGYQFVSGLLLGDNPNGAAKLITDLAITGGFLKYSRDDEHEADRLGAKYLHDAGYDPQAMVDFLERLLALEASQPSQFEAWLMTHPTTSDRLTKVRAEIARFPKLSNPVRNATAYAAIKAQLPK